MEIIKEFFVKAIIITIILCFFIFKFDYLKEFINKPFANNLYKILLICIAMPLLIWVVPYILPIVLLVYLLCKSSDNLN